jgi:hypothetical protein
MTTNHGTLKIYYWRGQGAIGSIVRHASSSQWGHVGIGAWLDGASCYRESFPGTGFRVVPFAPGNPPQGFQETGIVWRTEVLDGAIGALCRRRYSYVNGILAAFGHRRDSKNIQCAQAAEIILRLAGMDLRQDLIPEPQGIANEVERLTGNPVRRLFGWGGRPISYRGMPGYRPRMPRGHKNDS